MSEGRDTNPPPCTHNLFLLPVSPSAGELDDLHSFDPATMTWTLLAAANGPSSRARHGFTSAGGKLYVHGGTVSLETDSPRAFAASA